MACCRRLTIGSQRAQACRRRRSPRVVTRTETARADRGAGGRSPPRPTDLNKIWHPKHVVPHLLREVHVLQQAVGVRRAVQDHVEVGLVEALGARTHRLARHEELRAAAVVELLRVRLRRRWPRPSMHAIAARRRHRSGRSTARAACAAPWRGRRVTSRVARAWGCTGSLCPQLATKHCANGKSCALVYKHCREVRLVPIFV